MLLFGLSIQLFRKAYLAKTLTYSRLKFYCNAVNQLNFRYFATDVRNIGIMAHIDAGKTTTTERMLYYAGFIKRMGDIDAGDTVMDYLPSERERGITVQSAAISFNWLNTLVNLVDTPGHVDFTIEVERSLRVLDGAIALFDASKGVEAQSRTVWRQADRHNVPRIVYINKMDKAKASLSASIDSIKSQLKANLILLQIPIIENSQFIGVADLVEMNTIVWDMTDRQSNRSGRNFSSEKLSTESELWDVCIQARTNIIEQLCDLYDDVAEAWLEGEHPGDPTTISSQQLHSWLRRATVSRTAVPVLCGSSFKNIAVQPLLDAVVHYLPKPSDIHHQFTKSYGDTLTAMAFKVLFDKKLGPLVFVRLYSGKLKSGMTIYNASKSCNEKISRLMNVFADEYRNVDQLSAGNIGLVGGLKNTTTGDTLVMSQETYEAACVESSQHSDSEGSKDSAILTTVPIHEPVFFCTIEVQSLTQEKALEQALTIITCEDPSVRLQHMDGGVVVVSGMGELHMDIIIERLKNEFKVDAYIGPLQVAYKEVPSQSVRHKSSYSRKILDKEHHVSIDISMEPCIDVGTPTKTSDVLHRTEVVVKLAAARGVLQACQKGNLLGYPVMWAKFRLRSVKTSPDCPATLITAAACKCVNQALEQAGCFLAEPMMNIELNTVQSAYQDVINQLHKHQAVIDDVTGGDDSQVIYATAPVAEMKGFASSLRSATSGLADFTLEIAGYRQVSDERMQKIKDQLSGVAS